MFVFHFQNLIQRTAILKQTSFAGRQPREAALPKPSALSISLPTLKTKLAGSVLLSKRNLVKGILLRLF
ncbi:hypothetical protein BgiBS90_009763 [Biomphalaria glabrata]|nr:hypothetical protein BgiBS90_009763 [Biomphalaria glabrata]